MSDVVAVENTTADRFRTPRLIIMLTPGVIILLVSLVLPVAWLFHVAVERRFMVAPPPAPRGLSVPVAVA